MTATVISSIIIRLRSPGSNPAKNSPEIPCFFNALFIAVRINLPKTVLTRQKNLHYGNFVNSFLIFAVGIFLGFGGNFSGLFARDFIPKAIGGKDEVAV